jgi:hypothetical protein
MATAAQKRKLKEISSRVKALRKKVDARSSSSKSSSSSSKSSKKTTSKSTTTSSQLANIRKQVEKIQEQVASKDLSNEQRKKALETVKSAQQTLQSIKSKSSSREREEILEMEEKIADVEVEVIPMIDMEIGGATFSIPEDMANSAFFKGMDDNYKALAANMWKKVFDEGHSIKNFISAMEVAAEQTDAYMASKIRLFEDEIARSFTELGEDLEAQEKLYDLRKKQIQDDLERYEEFSQTKMGRLYENLNEQERLVAIQSGRIQADVAMRVGDLTLDQQRDMKTIADEYDIRLETTRETMVSRGLGRSTIRREAEELLEKSREDIIESTKTKYERQQRNIEIEAERQEENIENEIQRIRRETGRSEEDIRRELEEKRIQTERGVEDYTTQMEQFKKQTSRSATDILRKGETYFGSDKMTQLLPHLGIKTGIGDWMPSDWMVGDISGGYKTDWTQDWRARLQSMLGT